MKETTADGRSVFVDPSYVDYYGDRLFDTANPLLNRDDCLAPFANLRSTLAHAGSHLQTADFLIASEPDGRIKDYYSLGLLDNIDALGKRADVRLRAFVVFEPPVVAPKLYRALPWLTSVFEEVYVHNVEGDGYSLAGVDVARLRPLVWPQPYGDVIDKHWGREQRQNKIVAICGNHIPRSRHGELYSRRIEAMAEIASLGAIDLYGRGWEKWWHYRSMWLPYWKNRATLMSIYRGACESKYEVLSQYKFSLCFENMAMKGYVTEKLFDCLYAGTVPLYLGAKDISELVAPEAFIDCRQFSSWDELAREVQGMSDQAVLKIREAGREFLRSAAGQRYCNALAEIFSD